MRKNLLEVILALVGFAGTVIAVLLFMDNRYAKKEDTHPNLYADAPVTVVDYTGPETRCERKVHLDSKSLLLIYGCAHTKGEDKFSTLQVPSSAVRIAIDNKPVAANKDSLTFSSMDYTLDNSATYFAILDPGDFLISAERTYEIMAPKQGAITLKVQAIALRPAVK